MRGDATRLPFAPDAVDAVVIVWLPHLLPDPAPVPAEAAGVPRPGGVLITAVDKDDAYFSDGRAGVGVRGPDGVPRNRAGPQPAQVARGDRRGPYPLGHARAPPHRVTDMCRRLAALPDQDAARPDPLHRLIALKA